MKHKYRSALSQARNSGSASSGAHHWWHQRLTAVIMIITVFWVISFFWHISRNEASGLITYIQQPYNIIMLLVLFTTAMYHAVLGMQVVIEDYISYQAIRLVLIVGTKIFAIITTTAFAVAVLYIMTL